MSTRWTYRTETVELDGNTVECRGLTVGERAKFIELSKRARAGEYDKAQLPSDIVRMGAPGISDADLAAMPFDLLERAFDKILELSGFKDDEAPSPAGDAAAPGGEKKA